MLAVFGVCNIYIHMYEMLYVYTVHRKYTYYTVWNIPINYIIVILLSTNFQFSRILIHS